MCSAVCCIKLQIDYYIYINMNFPQWHGHGRFTIESNIRLFYTKIHIKWLCACILLTLLSPISLKKCFAPKKLNKTFLNRRFSFSLGDHTNVFTYRTRLFVRLAGLRICKYQKPFAIWISFIFSTIHIEYKTDFFFETYIFFQMSSVAMAHTPRPNKRSK